MRPILLSLSLSILAFAVSAQIHRAWSPRVNVAGQQVCVPYDAVGGAKISTSGFITDSGASNLSKYFTIGVSKSNVILNVVLTPLAGYTGNSVAGYWSNEYCHGGPMLRYTDNNNFGGMVTLNAEPTNRIETIDRVAGTEYKVFHNLPANSIQYGRPYRLLVDNSSGNTFTVSCWDMVTGALLTNFTASITNTAISAGVQGTHTYGQSFVVNEWRTTYPDGTVWMSTSQQWVQNHANDQKGLWASNGVLRVFSNGSSNSVNGWIYPVSTIEATAGSIRGIMRPISGRNHGISFKNTEKGNGIAIYWDQSNGDIRVATNVPVSPSIVGTFTGSLSYGTSYEWTLRFLSSTTFSWTINGATYTVTNSTYPTGKFFGLLGFQALTEHSNIRVMP